MLKNNNIICVITCFFIILFLNISTVFSLQNEIIFEDVPLDYEYAKEIEAIYKEGLINGRENRMFFPEKDISYAESPQILSN